MSNLGETREDYWTAIRSAAKDVLEQAYNDEAHEAQQEALDEGVYSMADITAGLDSISELYPRIAWFAVRADMLQEVERRRS